MASEQIFQVAVKALIRNAEGKILMVHLPEWGHNPAHWDFPGGRMDPGEVFLETLERELQEEIGTGSIGTPKQLAAMITSVTIPVGDALLPLIYVIYDVAIPADAEVRLDPDSHEDEFEWVEPADAYERMSIKFTQEFRDIVRAMS